MLPPLKYLMSELKFKTSDWTSLPDADKTALKLWADGEQAYIASQQK